MSSLPGGTSKNPPSIAFRIVFIYLVIGVVWILAGDMLLNNLVPSGPDNFLVGLAKGLCFILGTGLLLQVLISRGLANMSRLERETAQKEDLFRAVFDNAPEAIVVLDSAGKVLRANVTACRWLNLPNEKVEGVLYSDLLPFGRESSTQQVWGDLQSGKEVRGEVNDVPIGDERHDFEYTARADVAPGYHLVMLRDVTANKVAERELKTSEHNAHTIMEQASDGIIITDHGGRLVDANSCVCEMLGYTREELFDLKPSDIVSQGPVEQELARFEALRQGASLLSDRTMRRKNGSSFPAEISSKMLDDGRLLGIVRDMTERKEREEALRLSEERFKAQYKGIPVPTYTWQKVGDDFVLVDYNAEGERITDGRISEILGKRASDLYRDQAEITQNFSLCFREKRTVHYDAPYKMLSTGKDFHFSISYVYVPPDLIMVHTEDIAERIEHERSLTEHSARQTQLLTQLLTAQEAERRRLSMDIHDGPLQSLGVSLMAIDRAIRRSELGQYSVVEQEMRNLRSTLSGTVEEVRAVLADLSMDVLSRHGLVIALRKHIELFSEITGLNVSFQTTLEISLPQYLEMLLYRLAQESLSNIRKHSGAAHAGASLGLNTGALEMIVSDDGKGFDPQAVQEPGRAGERIGLRSMRQRVEDAGGQMVIDTAPGKGTKLCFRCPLPAD